MHQINIHEAKTNLSKLIQEALNGEEVIIAKGNKPVVKLVPLQQQKVTRQLGLAKGKITMTDDFDAPLDDFSAYM
ncbi:type II toxin-antitoxin system Phd/YefM family antitoxin [Ghiorsea bivora]|uniref:type II toxin-antitoxin system Phd/YefM family antitoxin n=1 Tax=Ghiorsea bivora TaxID=1485545 RepID=UPI000570A5AD|nr:type II toxin-antitoxin system Phd/YefM family antitoxin [Ghiorsea bivora]